MKIKAIEMNEPGHSLTRMNPKGQEFVGQCVYCKEQDLPVEATGWFCPVLLRRYADEIDPPQDKELVTQLYRSETI